VTGQPYTVEEFVTYVIDQDKTPDIRQMSGEVRKEFEAAYVDEVSRMIERALIEALPQEHLPKLEAMMNTDSDDEDVQAYIHQHVPNVQQLISTVLLAWKTEYLSA
jgi:hypothetical protein